MEIRLQQLSDLPALIPPLLSFANGRKVWLFKGQIGAGKTTIVQALCAHLGVEEEVTSPTYALVNEYQGDEIIYHLDLYRLNTVEEALDIGIEDYLYSGQYCLVEWPELIEEIAQEAKPITIDISINPDSSRNILLLED